MSINTIEIITSVITQRFGLIWKFAKIITSILHLERRLPQNVLFNFIWKSIIFFFNRCIDRSNLVFNYFTGSELLNFFFFFDTDNLIDDNQKSTPHSTRKSGYKFTNWIIKFRGKKRQLKISSKYRLKKVSLFFFFSKLKFKIFFFALVNVLAPWDLISQPKSYRHLMSFRLRTIALKHLSGNVKKIPYLNVVYCLMVDGLFE